MNVTGEIQVGFYLDNLDNQIGSVMVDGSSLTKGLKPGMNVSVPWKAVSGTQQFLLLQIRQTLSMKEAMTVRKIKWPKTYVVAKDSSNDTSIILLILVVVISIGAVGYTKDSYSELR